MEDSLPETHWSFNEKDSLESPEKIAHDLGKSSSTNNYRAIYAAAIKICREYNGITINCPLIEEAVKKLPLSGRLKFLKVHWEYMDSGRASPVPIIE